MKLDEKDLDLMVQKLSNVGAEYEEIEELSDYTEIDFDQIIENFYNYGTSSNLPFTYETWDKFFYKTLEEYGDPDEREKEKLERLAASDEIKNLVKDYFLFEDPEAPNMVFEFEGRTYKTFGWAGYVLRRLGIGTAVAIDENEKYYIFQFVTESITETDDGFSASYSVIRGQEIEL